MLVAIKIKHQSKKQSYQNYHKNWTRTTEDDNTWIKGEKM